MYISLLFKEPIHGELDQYAHDSISFDATASLQSANHDTPEEKRPSIAALTSQLDLAQTYLAYRLGFSDTVDGGIPSKGDVEAAASKLTFLAPSVGSAATLIKATIDIVDKKIGEELEKLPASGKDEAQSVTR